VVKGLRTQSPSDGQESVAFRDGDVSVGSCAVTGLQISLSALRNRSEYDGDWIRGVHTGA